MSQFFLDELIIIKAKHTEERPNYKIEAVGNYLKNNSTGLQIYIKLIW